MNTIQVSDNTLSALVAQTATDREPMLLITAERQQAILLSIDMFEALINYHHHVQRPLPPFNELQAKFRQDLIDAGYESNDSILNLLQEVKLEMLAEREPPAIKVES